jgi:alpha-beta hydrolase superfamily lysophospholipase
MCTLALTYSQQPTNQPQTQPCFLLGEGLGGTLAYQTYQMQGGRFWDGLVLLSPTLAFPKRLRPPPFLLSVARRLSPARWGAVPIVPYSRLYLDLLTDPARRQEASR